MQPLWKTVWRFLKKLKIELPYDPTIPLLGIYPDKTIIQKDTRTPMFIAALFTIAKTWKQPKCLLTEEWIKKTWYMYTVGYCSAIKKKETMPFAATWMQLESITLSKSERERQIPYDITYMLNLKFDTNEPYLQSRNRLTDIENRLVVAKGEECGGGTDWEFWD